MIARESRTGREPASASFELERFDWTAPDRLMVSGRFAGLRGRSTGDPELVVSGAAGVHRLPAVEGSVSGSPGTGGRWVGTFAWKEVPVPFDSAELSFGGAATVPLPQPGARRGLRRQVLEVVEASEGASEEEVAEASEEEVAEAGDEAVAQAATQDAPPPPRPDAAERITLEAELLAAQESAHQARDAGEQAAAELARAREDLATERRGRAQDAERFRTALESFRASAEEAVAAERGSAEQARTELTGAQEALTARESEVEELRGELAARDGRDADIEAELDALRGRVAELASAGEERDRQRAELDQLRRTFAAAQDQAERLLDHLRTGDEGRPRGE